MTTPHPIRFAQGRLNPLPHGERELPKVIFGGIAPKNILGKVFFITFGILLLASVLVACASIPPANSNQATSPPTTSIPAPTSTPTNPITLTSPPTPTNNPMETPTPSGLKITTLSIINSQQKAVTIEVEVAATPEEFQTGLMYRKSLPEMQGMLFDFSLYGDSVNIPFFMKNTYIPLSIAFISGDGRIVDIQDMEALSEALHYPSAPYHYALEVNQGWFGKYGIAVGDAVKF